MNKSAQSQLPAVQRRLSARRIAVPGNTLPSVEARRSFVLEDVGVAGQLALRHKLIGTALTLTLFFNNVFILLVIVFDLSVSIKELKM